MWKSFKQSLDSPDSYVSLALGLAVVLVVGMITFNYFKAKMQSATKTESQQAQQKEEIVSLPATYTVKAGDTLWSIAENFYKSGYNWVDIQKANTLNNPNYVEQGQILQIPDVKPIVPPGDISELSAAAQAQPKTYTVVRGDNLWKIAVNVYGNGYKWVEIAQANHLVHPNTIHAGNVLSLP